MHDPASLPPAARAAFPVVRLAVIADPHVFDAVSSRPGPAWDRNLSSGIKLLAESSEILEQALAAIAAERPDVLLVCGDLTKDGERASHELAARALARLQEGRPGAPGPRVLVVPGNHDIANPRAARFLGEAEEQVPTVSPAQFAGIYAETGYAGAIARDPSSLSYLAEPVPGLLVLAIDSCGYREDGSRSVSGCRVSAATLAWIRDALVDARARGAVVVALMHHGVTWHFPGQHAVDPSRVVGGADRLARLLLEGGVRVVFTGHGHAQDAALVAVDGRFLADVETGSLVTYPNPWRAARLGSDGIMRIESRRILTIPSRGAGFQGYSRSRLREGMSEAIGWALRRAGVRQPDATRLAGQAAETTGLFYEGDEQAGEVVLDLDGMCGWSVVVGNMLEGPLTRLANDTPPPDNTLLIDLAVREAQVVPRAPGSERP